MFGLAPCIELAERLPNDVPEVSSNIVSKNRDFMLPYIHESETKLTACISSCKNPRPAGGIRGRRAGGGCTAADLGPVGALPVFAAAGGVFDNKSSLPPKGPFGSIATSLSIGIDEKSAGVADRSFSVGWGITVDRGG